jgi:hypothetical protein
MHPNESRPGCRVLALWRRRQRVALQDIADRLIADLVPKISQRPHDPVITPVTVLLGHANDHRRLKIIPNAFGERAVLKLMFGALIRAAERWRSIKVTEFEHRQITAVRKELDQEYEVQVGLKTQLSKDAAPVKISSNLRT